MSLRPLDDRVLVDLDGDEETWDHGGLIIKPESLRQPSRKGTVIAVGPGRTVNGVRQPIPLEPGDRVWVNKYAHAIGEPYHHNGALCYLVREPDVLGHQMPVQFVRPHASFGKRKGEPQEVSMDGVEWPPEHEVFIFDGNEENEEDAVIEICKVIDKLTEGAVENDE